MFSKLVVVAFTIVFTLSASAESPGLSLKEKIGEHTMYIGVILGDISSLLLVSADEGSPDLESTEKLVCHRLRQIRTSLLSDVKYFEGEEDQLVYVQLNRLSGYCGVPKSRLMDALELREDQIIAVGDHQAAYNALGIIFDLHVKISAE